MAQINNFKDFTEEVLRESNLSTNVIKNIVRGLFSSFHMGIGAGAVSAPNFISVNNRMYLDYLEKEYKERFEAHKNDANYIQMLISEAVKKIKAL